MPKNKVHPSNELVDRGRPLPSALRVDRTNAIRDSQTAFYRVDRFLSALIFLRRAKRKLVQPVEFRAIEVNAHVHRTNRVAATDSREESFGQMVKLGSTRGVIWTSGTPNDSSRSLGTPGHLRIIRKNQILNLTGFFDRCIIGFMPERSSKKLADLNQIAKSIVDEATMEELQAKAIAKGKNPAAVMLGRLGGLKGGKARATKLTAKRRSEIAKKAAKARWEKRS